MTGRDHERARRDGSYEPNTLPDGIRGGSRKARRSRARAAARAADAAAAPTDDPLLGNRFRVCTCEPTNYGEHAECVRRDSDESECP